MTDEYVNKSNPEPWGKAFNGSVVALEGEWVEGGSYYVVAVEKDDGGKGQDE